jgi:Pyruvate phosphate dikinase, AMP/ATP-binding domain
MNSSVLGFEAIDKTHNMLVGGKGANLKEISNTKGIRVSDGFAFPPKPLRESLVRPRQSSQMPPGEQHEGKTFMFAVVP